MSLCLKAGLNLVLSSSWPLRSSFPHLISRASQGCRLVPEQALNKAAPAVAGLMVFCLLLLSRIVK